MPVVPGPASKTGLTVDRATNTIRLVREFGAPPAVIFDAWTQPEHVASWWDPAGERLQECDIDLRPGGEFRFVSRAHPELPFTGTYREIRAPERLVFDALGAKGRVALQREGAGTRMVVEIECASAEHLDQFLKVGVDVGTAQTLDNLVMYLGQRTAAA